MKNLLLAGRTGVGKSSFINLVLGRAIAPVDRYRPCTKSMEHYPTGDLCFHDSPGLAEGDGQQDDVYLSMVKERLQTVRMHGIISFGKLTDTRFTEEEAETLKKLVAQLGAAIWRSAWLVFTFAARVPVELRTERATVLLNRRAELLRKITSLPGKGPPFTGFRGVLLLDNSTTGWATDGQPLLDFFPSDQNRERSAAVAESLYPLVRYTDNIR